MRHRIVAVTHALIAISILTLSHAAHAFKIDTHLWIAQQVFNDVADDGQITVKLNGNSIIIPVPYEVSSAILSNRNALLMGNMGPDVPPDVVVGQILVHPGQAVFSLLGATEVMAVWTAPAKVSYVNIWPAGFRFVLHQLTPDCPGGINQLYVDWTAPNAKAMYAMVVVALQSGDLVAANYGCDAVLGPTTSNIDVRKSVSW